jgi:hypothetical protein
METWRNGAQGIFLNLFTVSSFVDEETNASYPFANRLNGLAHLHVQISYSKGCYQSDNMLVNSL